MGGDEGDHLKEGGIERENILFWRFCLDLYLDFPLPLGTAHSLAR